MYAEGLGVRKDMTAAPRLYEAAAASGEFLAQVALGRLYSQGIDVPEDRAAALRWYSAAAAQEERVVDCEELREAKSFLRNV
jgi:TPR repeat protein